MFRELPPKAKRTSDIALHLKSFLFVLPTIVTENCFSLSLHSICFHGYQAFASKILFQGSPVHISFQNGPCFRKPEHDPAQASEDLCSDLFTAFKPWVLSEHKQSQRDIKNCLLRIVYTIPTHCSSSTNATHIFADFWLLCMEVVEQLPQVRETGREYIEPGKGVAYSLRLSWSGALQYFHCDKRIRIFETDGNNLKFNSVPARAACNTHIVSYCQNVIECLILFTGKGWVCILDGLILLLT